MIRRPYRLLQVCLATLLSCSTLARAEPEHPVVGWVEFVTLQPSGVITKAKLDTGALTSSMHAQDVEMFERDGRRWVRFRFHKPRTVSARHDVPAVPAINLRIEAPLNRMVRIKQHTVDFVERPEVDLSFDLGGHRYTTPFTLTDRSDFIYPVLLGRRFLADTVYVDAGRMHVTGVPSAPSSNGNR